MNRGRRDGLLKPDIQLTPREGVGGPRGVSGGALRDPPRILSSRLYYPLPSSAPFSSQDPVAPALHVAAATDTATSLRKLRRLRLDAISYPQYGDALGPSLTANSHALAGSGPSSQKFRSLLPVRPPCSNSIDACVPKKRAPRAKGFETHAAAVNSRCSMVVKARHAATAMAWKRDSLASAGASRLMGMRLPKGASPEAFLMPRKGRGKTVRFAATVGVRSYPSILSDHPCTSSGPPVGLALSFTEGRSTLPPRARANTRPSATVGHAHSRTAAFQLTPDERLERCLASGSTLAEVSSRPSQFSSSKFRGSNFSITCSLVVPTCFARFMRCAMLWSR